MSGRSIIVPGVFKEIEKLTQDPVYPADLNVCLAQLNLLNRLQGGVYDRWQI